MEYIDSIFLANYYGEAGNNITHQSRKLEISWTTVSAITGKGRDNDKQREKILNIDTFFVLFHREND